MVDPSILPPLRITPTRPRLLTKRLNKAAAAARHQQQFQVADLLNQFIGCGALAGDDIRLIIEWNHGVAVFPAEILGQNLAIPSGRIIAYHR